MFIVCDRLTVADTHISSHCVIIVCLRHLDRRRSNVSIYYTVSRCMAVVAFAANLPAKYANDTYLIVSATITLTVVHLSWTVSKADTHTFDSAAFVAGIGLIRSPLTAAKTCLIYCRDISALDDYLQGILGDAQRDLSRLRADVGISRSTATVSL